MPSGGFETFAPNNQSAAYIPLRPQDHLDRLCCVCFDNIIRNAVSLWWRRWRTEDIFIFLIRWLGCDICQCLLVRGGPTELHIVTTDHHNPNTHSCVKVKSTDHKLFALSCRIRSLCSVDRKGEVPLNPKQQEQDCKYCVPWQSTQMLPKALLANGHTVLRQTCQCHLIYVRKTKQCLPHAECHGTYP